MFDKVITKEFIDTEILPYTSEDSIFYGSVREVLLLDIKDKLGNEIYNELNSNNPSDNTIDLLDNKQLRLCIGYYVLSRTFRKPSTPTRYGITNKLNDSMASEPTSNAQAVSQSNYYKSVADEIMQKIVATYTKANTNSGFNIVVVGN